MSSPPSGASTGRSRDQRAAEVLPRRRPDRRGGQRDRPDRRRGRDLRPARAERRGQDHDPAHPHHAAAGRRRLGPRRRRRRAGRARRRPAADRLRQPARRGRQVRHRPGEPAAGRAALRPERRRRHPALRRAGRGLRPRRAAHPVRSAPTRAASAVGSRWRSASCTGRGCSSSTSRPPALTRRTAPTCGISSAGCGQPARRSASPRTTWTRPTSCATGWRSSITGASSRSAPPTSSSGGTRPTRSRSRPMSPRPRLPALARELADADVGRGERYRERGHQADGHRPDARDGGRVRRAGRTPGERAGGLGRAAVA